MAARAQESGALDAPCLMRLAIPYFLLVGYAFWTLLLYEITSSGKGVFVFSQFGFFRSLRFVLFGLRYPLLLYVCPSTLKEYRVIPPPSLPEETRIAS